MRKLLFASAGFAAGCAFCAYFCRDSIFPGLIFFALAGIFCTLTNRKLHPSILVCLGGLAGVIWYGIFAWFLLSPGVTEISSR